MSFLFIYIQSEPIDISSAVGYAPLADDPKIVTQNIVNQFVEIVNCFEISS